MLHTVIMLRNKCAACATPLGSQDTTSCVRYLYESSDAWPGCVRCQTRYCSATCRRAHWRDGHEQVCEEIARGGGAEQHYADEKYIEAAEEAIKKCADDTKGQTCYICTPKNEKGSDVYANFRAPYDAPYDRGAVRAEIDSIIRRAPLVLFGWSTCWFCTDAERLLKDANLPYRSVYMDLWKPGGPYHDHAVGDDGSLAAKRAKNIRKATNPLQAELALLAGRCTVPVVVVRGRVLDGDEQHGSVVEAIESGELARAIDDATPWAPAWPTAAPPPVVVTKRCRVCRGRYSDEENHAAACRHHPGALRGESARKGDWEATPSDDDLVWTYSCCGGAADAPGCVADRHRSYDDD